MREAPSLPDLRIMIFDTLVRFLDDIQRFRGGMNCPIVP